MEEIIIISDNSVSGCSDSDTDDDDFVTVIKTRILPRRNLLEIV